MCFASNPAAGTWKLNQTRSKITPGEPKNTKAVCATAGDEIRVITDGIDSDGTPLHN